ncbi:G-box binding factor [Orobanche gracilis]
MGSGEDVIPTKSSKPAPSAQEASSTPTTPAYPDWSSSMQAFYGAGATPPLFASTVASPTPHPFLWGGQHPLMSPYGTPIYPAMYPPGPGGVYAPLPNLVANPGNVHGSAEVDRKSIDGRDRASRQKTKGTSGNHGSVGVKLKAGDGGKATSGSGNDVGAQSAESGSEGSSDATADNNQDFSKTKKGSFDQMLADEFGIHIPLLVWSFFISFPFQNADFLVPVAIQAVPESRSYRDPVRAYQNENRIPSSDFSNYGPTDEISPVIELSGANAQNNTVPSIFQSSVAGNPVSSPATNLNMGMDLWNASHADSGGPNQAGVSQTVAPTGVMNDQWIHIVSGAIWATHISLFLGDALKPAMVNQWVVSEWVLEDTDLPHDGVGRVNPIAGWDEAGGSTA